MYFSFLNLVIPYLLSICILPLTLIMKTISNCIAVSKIHHTWYICYARIENPPDSESGCPDSESGCPVWGFAIGHPGCGSGERARRSATGGRVSKDEWADSADSTCARCAESSAHVTHGVRCAHDAYRHVGAQASANGMAEIPFRNKVFPKGVTPPFEASPVPTLRFRPCINFTHCS